MHALSVAAGTFTQPLASRQHRASEVDLLWIAGQLGLVHHERRTIIAKVRLLAEKAGFPLPKNPRFVKGTRITGPLAIDARSIWDRDPVERWIEDDRPPAETAAAIALRRTAVAEQMATRALSLVA
jgi:hypothetical protein